MSEAGVPWAQQQLAPQRVWPLTKGAHITVAVVDTGVDAATPQLAYAHVLPGVDLTSPSRGPANTDCYGHGTFNAGIIAATPAPGTGFAGMAPDVIILPIRCATTDTPNVAGSLTAEGMANGIRQAVDSGAQVINISASTTKPVPDLAAAIDYASQHDVVVVASAANTAQQGNPVTYPASYPSVVAVGAVDKDGKHADFSQTGPFVSLVAPGVAITSIGPGGPGQWEGNGTSYAAPFVAATAALIRAYRPGLTAVQVKHRLQATADHPAAALPDPALGWGTLNVMAAVTDELPEEIGSAASVVRPPGAHAAHLSAPDGLGPVLATASAIGVLVVVLALLVISRLFGEGHRRGWRRARKAQIRFSEPAQDSTAAAARNPTVLP
ncbi:type VII secretion-associated serine protease mycosin [Amycolatopsis sp. NPDC059090]|uniref:type VII secretion-associated serine protease mycosin n=1 Tax=unclassified Amycolatopsis TaxID=2618356 RepID=UPI00366FCA4D